MLSLVSSNDGSLPLSTGGSAPATELSGPARRSLTLRPVCSPDHLVILYTGDFDDIVTSAAAPVATGWSDQLPGGNRTR